MSKKCNCNHHQEEHHHHEHHDCGCGCHHYEHHDCRCGCHHDSECGCGHEHVNFKMLLLRVGISIVLMVASLFIDGPGKNILLSVAYLMVAYDVLSNAFANVIRGKLFDENFLMSLASLTALIVPFFTDKANIDPYDGILVIILYQIGEFIQHKAVDRSKQSISEMLDLDVAMVEVVTEEDVDFKLASEINVGDVIVLKPGEKIVVDGVVVKGSSTLNTQSLTGEAMPQNVYVGDKVLSSSINNEGVLHIKATSTFDTSTTARVKKVVEDANKSKAKLDTFFAKFAKIYTPIVILISLVVMFVLPLFFGFEEHFLGFLYKGLAIMVISCPCALVISISLSYFMGIGKAARNQILVKGASYLEILTNIDMIVFDKTGTLTKGTFTVTKEESSDLDLMHDLLYSVEKNFTHAIAVSITNYLKDNSKNVELSEITNLPGYGVSALHNGCKILIGNEKLLENNNVEFSKIDTIYNVVYVSYNEEYLGYLIIEDTLKNDATKTINELLRSYEIYVLSGDKNESVANTCNTLGIVNYESELLPDEKFNSLIKISKNKTVMYVGDGINDAACLIKSDIGLAMNSIGSDIAINASDIVLMDDNLESINKAFRIAKKTKRIVIQNIVFSLLVKIAVMFIAIVLSVPMSLAIIADVGVALIAIGNALRIMYGKI